MSSRTRNTGRRSNEAVQDFFFSSNGDFRLGDGGRLERTVGYDHRALVQTIVKRLSSTKYDWSQQPQVGANMGDFLGQNNSRETARLIKSRIVSELTRDRLISSSSLTVQIVPVSKTAILIAVFIRTDDPSQPIAVQFTYDMRDNKLIPRNL